MLRSFVKYIMVVVTGLIVFCYFLGLLAGWVSPEKMALPTYFVMAMPLWILLIIGLLIFWLCCKKWIHALIIIAIINKRINQGIDILPDFLLKINIVMNANGIIQSALVSFINVAVSNATDP